MREGDEASGDLAEVLDRVLAGEHDENVLCEGLDFEGSMIIETILHALADPSTLQDLLPEKKGK